MRKLTGLLLSALVIGQMTFSFTSTGGGTFTAVPVGIWYPIPAGVDYFNAFLSTASTIMNAGGETNVITFIVPKSGTIDQVEFRIGAVADNPDNGIKISFQDVTSSGGVGINDGSIDQFRDLAGPFTAATWQASGLITDDGTDGGVKRTVTAGQYLTIVWDFISFVAGDSFQPLTIITTPEGIATANFFSRGGTGGVQGNNTSIVLKYSDGSYVPISDFWLPYLATSDITFGAASSPDERALRFQLPFDAKIDGVSVQADFDNNIDIVIYDNADVALETATVTAGFRSSNGVLNAIVRFDEVEITKNTTYRISVKPQGSNVTSLAHATINSSALLGAFPGGAEWFLSTRTDAGSWTDTTTTRPLISMHISALK